MIHLPGESRPSSPAPITGSSIRAASAVAGTPPGASAKIDLASWDGWFSKGPEADAAFRKKARIVALVSVSLIVFGMLWVTLAP